MEEAAVFLEVELTTLEALPEKVASQMVSAIKAKSLHIHNLEAQSAELTARSELAEAEQKAASQKAQALVSRERELQAARAVAEEQAVSARQQLDLVRYDKRSLLDSLDRRSQELAQVRIEISEAEAQRQRSVATLRETQTQLIAIQSSNANAESELAAEVNRRTCAEQNAEYARQQLVNVEKSAHEARARHACALAELHEQIEQAQALSAASERRHKLLQSEHDSQTARLDRAIAETARLRKDRATLEDEFQREMQAERRAARAATQDAEHQRSLVSQLDRDLDAQRKENTDLECRTKDLEKQVGNLTAQLQETEQSLILGFQDLSRSSLAFDASSSTINPATNAPATPSNTGPNASRSSMLLSPAGRALVEFQGNGGSLVQIADSYSRAKREALRWKRKHDKLRTDMDLVLREVERNVPELVLEREQHQKLIAEVSDLSKRLEAQTKRAKTAERRGDQLKQRELDLEAENSKIATQLRDVARQLQYTLINSELSLNGQPLMRPAERETLANIIPEEDPEWDGDTVRSNCSDTDKLISHRMVLFKDVAQLQRQNQQLVAACRSIGRRAEEQEQLYRQSIADHESVAVQEAQVTLVNLTTKYKSLEEEVQQLHKERDMFRGIASTQDSEQVSQLENALADAAKLSTQYQDRYKEAVAKCDALEDELRDVGAQLARATADLEILGEQQRFSTEELKDAQTQIGKLNLELARAQETTISASSRCRALETEIKDARGEIELIRNELARSEAQIDAKNHEQQSIMAQLNTASNEAKRAVSALENATQTQQHREQEHTATQKRLLDQTETLQAQNSSLTQKLTDAEEQIRSLRSRSDVESAQHLKKLTETLDSLSTVQQELAVTKAANEPLEFRIKFLTERLSSARNRTSASTASKPATPQNESNTTLIAAAQKEFENERAFFATKIQEATDETNTLRSQVTRAQEELAQATKTAQNAISEVEKIQSTLTSEIELKDQALVAVQQKDETISELEGKLASEYDVTSKLKSQLSKEAGEAAQRVTSVEKKLLVSKHAFAELEANFNGIQEQNRILLSGSDTKLEGSSHSSSSVDAVRLAYFMKQIEINEAEMAKSKILCEKQAVELEAKTAALDRASAEVKGFWEQISSLEEALRRERETLSTQQSDSNAQSAELERRLEDALAKIRPLEASLEEAKVNVESLEEQIRLLVLSNEQWKKASKGEVDLPHLRQEISNLESQLKEKDTLVQTIREESQKKLLSQRNSLREEIGRMQARITSMELEQNGNAAKEVSHLNQELSKYKERAQTLENEINTASDELLEAQNKSHELSQELKAARSIIEDLQAQKVAPQATESSMFATGGTSEELDSLFKQLSSISDEETAQKVFDQIKAAVEKELKPRVHEHLRSKAEKLRSEYSEEVEAANRQLEATQAELKKVLSQYNGKTYADIEKALQAKFDMKQKLLRTKTEKLEATNKELSLTVRRLKGGDHVEVTTLPSGVTKVVEQAKPAEVKSGDSAGKNTPGTRPAVARPGAGAKTGSLEGRTASRRPAVQRAGSGGASGSRPAINRSGGAKRVNSVGGDNQVKKRKEE